jgi:ribosomal-protein-alanine N-acetyltransferase
MTELFANICGKNINLIKLDTKYLNDMWEYSSNPKMYEHFEFNTQNSIEDSKKYLNRLIQRSNGVDAYWWFIETRNIKKVIGSFGVHDIDFHRKKCEISYALSPVFWGKGIFSEALHLVLERLISDFNFHRITAVTSSNNIRSIQSLKKTGFKEEGEFREFYLNDNGIRYNATSLALLASEYIRL